MQDNQGGAPGPAAQDQNRPEIATPQPEQNYEFQGEVPNIGRPPEQLSPFHSTSEIPKPIPLQTSDAIDSGEYISSAAQEFQVHGVPSSPEESLGIGAVGAAAPAPPEAAQETSVTPEKPETLTGEVMASLDNTAVPTEAAPASAVPATQRDMHPGTGPQLPTEAPLPISTEHQEQAIPKKQKRGKGKKIAIIAGLATSGLLLLVAVFLAGYFLWYLPNRPNNIVARAIINGALSESSHNRFVSDYTVAIKDESQNAQVTIDGGLSQQVNLDQESLNIAGELSIRTHEITVAAGVLGEDELKLTFAEIPVVLKGVVTENRYMVQMDNVENLISNPEDIAGYLLEEFEDQVSAAELRDVREDIERLISETVTDVAKLNDRWFADSFEDNEFLKDLRSDGENGLTECLRESGEIGSVIRGSISAYQDYPVFEVLEDFGNEDVRGESMRHFKVRLNETNYSRYLAELASKARGNPEIVSCLEESEFQDLLEDPQFRGDEEIKLDPEDQLPDLVFDMWIDGEKRFRQVAFQADEPEYAVQVNLGLDYLKPESVVPPTSTEPIENLQNTLTEIADGYTRRAAELEQKYTDEQSFNGLDSFGDTSDDVVVLEDLEGFLAEIEAYRSEEGTVPLTEVDLESFIEERMSDDFKEKYEVRYSGQNVIPIEDDKRIIHFNNRVYCEGSTFLTTLDPQSAGVLIRLPSGSYSCRDNGVYRESLQFESDEDNPSGVPTNQF